MPRPRPRVVITCPTFEPGFRGGGPVRSVSQIVDSAPVDFDILLVTSDRDLGSSAPYPGLSGRCVARGNTKVLYLNTANPIQWIRLLMSIRRGHVDLLYLNSLWAPRLSLLPLMLHMLRVIPADAVLIAPRGELSVGALSLKKHKKLAVLRLLRPILSRQHVTWHASTELEAAEIRHAIGGAKIAVCVSSDQPPHLECDDYTTGEHANPRFVFVGRIVPKKNLILVLEALQHVTTPMYLDVYGPIEDRKYWSSCERAIEKIPGHVRVRYRGELPPDRVVRTFADYDVFVFPTRGENFGHIIAESLAATCAVICSDRTPWTSVLNAGGGEVLPDLKLASLTATLEKWAMMSPDSITSSHERVRRSFQEWFEGRDRTNVLELVLGKPS